MIRSPEDLFLLRDRANDRFQSRTLVDIPEGAGRYLIDDCGDTSPNRAEILQTLIPKKPSAIGAVGIITPAGDQVLQQLVEVGHTHDHRPTASRKPWQRCWDEHHLRSRLELSWIFREIRTKGAKPDETHFNAQASALNVLSREAEPKAICGHMSYYLWWPENGHVEVLVMVGLPRELLLHNYRTCTEEARIDAPLARPFDTNLPVFVCRDPYRPLEQFWSELRHFDHRLPAVDPGPGNAGAERP